MELSKYITELRISRGETMEEFGLNFNPPASKGIVNNWEKGRNRPNITRLYKIAELGGVTIEKIQPFYESTVSFDLTEVEKQIIEAYRNGAYIDVTYYTYSNDGFEEAVEKVMKFGKVTQILDVTSEDGSEPSFISIVNKERQNLEVKAFLNVKRKATHGNE